MENLLKNLGGVTLKSLLENPSLLQTSAQLLGGAAAATPDCDNIKGTEKDSAKDMSSEEALEKKLKDVEGEFFAPTDFGAAFLGPNLWDKTYGDDDFNYKLEYMELDEFLSENGLPLTTVDSMLPKEQQDVDILEDESDDEDGVSINMSLEGAAEDTDLPEGSDSPKRKAAPVNVDVNYDLSLTDVALATIPGQDVYDPRTRTFSEEELKPQPMIKKSRKVYVLPDQKDDKYWDRRRKNNIAAKRSRDARRIKENQISMRAGFLEKENNVLRKELLAIKKENVNLKKVVKTYECKLGILE